MPKFSPLVAAGWPVIPLARDGKKTPLVNGRHGEHRQHADVETVRRWAKEFPDCNPGIVLPDNVIGFDVDGPSHGVNGLEAIEAFESKFGPLPAGGHIFHGRDSKGKPSPYGTRLYRIPDDMLDVYTPGHVVGNLNKVTGKPGVDVIAPWIRYNVAPGAVHSSGETYEWSLGGTLPEPDSLPVLSRAQVEAVLKRQSKPIRGAERPRTAKERAGDLLAQTRALAALDEGQTLLIEGEERGWQRGNGFFVLACALVRLAKNREKAKAAFVKAAAPYDDAERQWDNAEASVDAEEAEREELLDDEVYSCSVSQDAYTFTKEVLDRHFRDTSGVLTLRMRDEDETFWLWNARKARYVQVSDSSVQAIVARHIAGAREVFMTADGPETRPIKVKSSTYGEVVKNLRILTLANEYGGGELLPSVGGVPFLNGWLNVETGQLEPIGPERDVRWNVPLEYDTNGGPTTEWHRFLKSIGWGKGTQEYRLLRQWFGYVLSGSKAQQKALVLIGPTRSGKGTILKVCSAMLGEGAVGTQMDALADKNGLENVVGKGLITVGDARFAFRTDKGLAGRLLSLTGDDEMTINAKYKNLISARLDARLMLATNEPPQFTEASDALARRFVMLSMEESFLGHEDFGLEKRLLRELPGIVAWSLEGLRDLNDVGKFVQTDAGSQIQEQMVRDAAPLRVFIEEECEFGEGFWVEQQVLYDEYVLWARQNGLSFILPKQMFFRDLNTAFPGMTKNYFPRRNGRPVRCRSGLRLKR